MTNCDQPLDLTVKKEKDDVVARGPNFIAPPSPVAAAVAAATAAVRSERHVAGSRWSDFDPPDVIVAGGHGEIRRSGDGRDVMSRSSSGAVAAAIGAGSALSPSAAAVAAAANRRLDSDRWRAPAPSSSVARSFSSSAPASCSPSAGTVASASLAARSTGYEHLYGLQQQQQLLLYASCTAPQPSGAALARDRSARSMQQEAAAVAASAAASCVPSAPHETAARSRSADARALPHQQLPESGLPMYRQVSPGGRSSRSPHAVAAAAAAAATVPSNTSAAAMAAASREPLLLHDVLQSIYKQTAGEPAFMQSPAASFRNGAGAPSPRQLAPSGPLAGLPAPMPPPQSPGGRMQPSLSRRSSSPLAWDDPAAAAALQLRPGRLATAASALERPSAAASGGGSSDDAGAFGVHEGLAQDLSRGVVRHTSARRPGDGIASEGSTTRPPPTATSPAKPGRPAGSTSAAPVPTSTAPGHLDADRSRWDALSKFHMQQQQQLLLQQQVQQQQQHYARSARTASTHSRPAAADGHDSSLDGRTDGDCRRGRLAIGVGNSPAAARATVQDEAAAAALYDRRLSAADSRGSLMSASTLLSSPFSTFMPRYVTSADDSASARLPSAGPARSAAVTPSEAAVAAAAVRAASLSPDGSGRHGRGSHGLGLPHAASAATRVGSLPVSMAAAPTSSATQSQTVVRAGSAASQSQHRLPLAFSPVAGASADAVFEAQLQARRHVPAVALNDDLLISTNVNAPPSGASGGREQFTHRGRGSSTVDLRALAAADVKALAPAAGDFGCLSYRDASDVGSDGYSGGSGPSAMVTGHTVPASGLLSSGTPMKRHRGQQQQQQLSVLSLTTSAADRVSTAYVGSSSSSSGHYTAARVSWSGEHQQLRELCYRPPLLGNPVGCTWQPALLLPPPIARLPSGPHEYNTTPARAAAAAAPPPPPPWPSASRQPPVSPQQLPLPPRHQASCPPFASAAAETGGSVPPPPPPLPSASPPSSEPICLVKNYAAGRETSPQQQQGRRAVAASSYGGSSAVLPSPAHGHVQLAASASSGRRSPAASVAGGTLPGAAEGASPEAADRLPSRHSVTTAGPVAIASGFLQPLTAGSLRPAVLLREPYDIDDAAAAGTGHSKRIPASTGLPAPADSMPQTASHRTAGSPSHLPSTQSTQFPSRTSFLSLAAAAAANSGAAFGGVAITCVPALATSGAAAIGSAGGISAAAGGGVGGVAPVTTAATVVVDAYSGGGYRSGPSSLPGVAASAPAVSRIVSKVIPVANVQPFFKNALSEGCASVSTATLSADAPTTPHKPLQLPPAEKHRSAKDAVLPPGGAALPEFPAPTGAPKVAEQPRSVSSCGASTTEGLAEAAPAWSPPVSKSMPNAQERGSAAAASAAAATASAAEVPQHRSRAGMSELPLDDVPSAAQRASPPPMKAISALDGKAAGRERLDVPWSCVDVSASSGPGIAVRRITDEDLTAVQSPLASSSSGGSGSNLFKRLSQHRKDYSLHPKKRPYVVAECESPGGGMSSSIVGGGNGVAVAVGASAPAAPSASSRGRRCSQLPSSIGSASMPLQLCSSKRKKRSLLDEIANTEGYVAECDRLPDRRRKLRLATRQSFTVAGSLTAGVFKMKQKRRQSLKVKSRASDDATTSAGVPADGGSSMLRAWSAKATRRAAADRRRRVSREAQASGIACDSKIPRVSKRGTAAASSAAARATAAVSPAASRSPSPPLAVIAARGKLSHSVDGDDEEEEEEEEGDDSVAFTEESGASCSSSKTMALARSAAMRGRKRRGPPPRDLRLKERSKRFRTTQATIEGVRSGANSVCGAVSRSNNGRARYVPLSRPFARISSLAAAAVGSSRPSRPAPVAEASATCCEPPGSLSSATYRTEGFSSRAAMKAPQPAAIDEVAFELCNFYLPVYTRDVVAAVGLADFVLLQDVLQNSRCLLSRDRLSAACGAPSAVPLASLRALACRTVANAELALRDDLADPVEIMPYSRNLRRILGIKTEMIRMNSIDSYPMTASAEAAADRSIFCPSAACLTFGSTADSEEHPLEKKPFAGPAAAPAAAASHQTPAMGSRSLSSAGDQLSHVRTPVPAAADAAVQQTALPKETNRPPEADSNSLAAPAATGSATVSIAPSRLTDPGKENGSLQTVRASTPAGVAKCSSEHAASAAAIAVAGRLTTSSVSASASQAVSVPLPPVAEAVNSPALLSTERPRPPLILRLPLSSSTSCSSPSSSSLPQVQSVVSVAPACLPASSLPRPASTQPTVTLQRLSRELLVSCGGSVGPSDSTPLVTAVAVGGCTEGVACGQSSARAASSPPIDGAAAATDRTASTAAPGSATVALLSSETAEGVAEDAKQHNRRSSLTLSLPLSLPLTFCQHKPPPAAIASAADAAARDDDARPSETPVAAAAAAAAADASALLRATDLGGVPAVPSVWLQQKIQQRQLRPSDAQQLVTAVTAGVSSSTDASADADASNSRCCPFIQHFDEDATATAATSPDYGCRAVAAAASDSSAAAAAAASPLLLPLPPLPATLPSGTAATAAEECTMPTLTPVYAEDRGAGNCMSFV